MIKWVGGVLILVGMSLMASGLISALLDLAAFLLLTYAVIKRSLLKQE
ncbi:hypothetical protein [uncultured Photobacterium sp.]|nr:hypothetical protein [uncultured Photobacterium sp.]